MIDRQSKSEDPSARAPRRRRAPRGLFALLALALVLIFGAGLILAFSVPLLRERQHLRRVLFQRLGPITITSLEYNRDPERQAELRECYLDPQNTDPADIAWNLLCRPTAFVGYAPEPGEQQDGLFNEHQMRNADPLPMPKPAGEYRIFLIGGSLAYGIGTPDADSTIDMYLERELEQLNLWPGRRAEVWNAAVCGWASTQERLWIETHLAEWQPDMILELTGVNDVHWGFDGNDVFDLRTYEDRMYFELINTAMRIAGVRPYPQEPPRRHSGPVPPAEVARKFLKNIRLAATGLAITSATQPAAPRYVVALQPTLAHKLHALSEAERKWIRRVEPEGKPQYLLDSFALFDDGLRKLAEPDPARVAVELAELRDVFKGRGDSIYLDLYHVGDKGNQLIAQRLAAELRRLTTAAEAAGRP